MEEIKSASIKQIYFWNLMGSVCNALTSMVLLIVVMRTTDNHYADIFSIGFAIAQLLVTIGVFQVRNYQSTDVSEKFQFQDYFFFRLLTCFIMILCAFGYVILKDYESEKKLIVLLICFSKVIEAFADVFQGLFQQKERLDLSGKSMVLRSIATSVVFTLCMILTHNLLIASIALLISSIICLCIYDLPKHKLFTKLDFRSHYFSKHYQTLCNIAWQCLPLFLNGFLIMSIYNMPKNAIDLLSERGIIMEGMQSDYGILFMPASVINFFLIFLRPFMTSMAYAWMQKNQKRFARMGFQIGAGVCIFAALVVLGAFLLGIPILEFLSSRDLHAYRTELILLMIAGGLSSLATVMDNIITVIRMQHILVISYLLSWVTAKCTALYLVEKSAMLGAVEVFLISMALLCIVNGIILVIGIKKQTPVKNC